VGAALRGEFNIRPAADQNDLPVLMRCSIVSFLAPQDAI